MSAFLLGNLDKLTFYIIMAGITGFGSILLFLLYEPLSENVIEDKTSLIQ